MKIIKIHGEIGWEFGAQDLNHMLENVSGDIVFDVNSGGGDVFEGVAIFNAIKNYNGGKTTTLVTSLAGSIASYIALASDEVHVYENSTYMIHNAKSGIYGDANELLKRSKVVNDITLLIANEYVKKTGINLDDVLKLMQDETYMFGKNIVDVGFADTLISTVEIKNVLDKELLVTAQTAVLKCDENCAIRTKKLATNIDDFRALHLQEHEEKKVVNKYLLEANQIIKGIK